MTTVDQFLARVQSLDPDRLQVARGEPQFERGVELGNMAIDIVESVIAGEPYIEQTHQIIQTSPDVSFTRLPEGTLRVDDLYMLRDRGGGNMEVWYSLDPKGGLPTIAWNGGVRGRTVGYYIEGEEIYWDPARPAQVFDIRLTGLFTVPDMTTEPDALFPLHDAYVNPTAAIVSRLFEHARGESTGQIQSLAYEMLQPVMDMRRRRERTPTTGRFRFANL